MEIVQVVGFYPPHLGGQEAVVERLARMQADCHRVTVYTSDVGAGPGPATDTAPPTRSGPVRVVRDRTWVLARTPVVPLLPLRLLRHQPTPDLLHVHVGQALIPELVALAARLRGVPYVRVAVEAMRLLPRDVVLRVVGDGELRDELTRLAAELDLPNVRFTGRLPREEVAAAYRRATVVLLPSEREGLPLVLLEALSAGAPVVCSARPELVEVGGPAVVPVDPLTAESLAAAVRALLDDPARRAALSAAARRRAADYAWPAVAAAVDAVYAEVLAENEPAGVAS